MENNKKVASSSYWWLGKPISSKQSPWLQDTLNDLDEKMKVVVSLIMQDEGDTFAQRAERYYKNRTQLVNMMEEFHRSYRCLAERYNQLRLELDRASTSSNVESSQNIDRNEANENTADTSDPNPASVCAVEDPESNTIEHDAELFDAKEEICKTDNSDEKCGRQITMSCSDKGDVWLDMKMQVSKLIEENIKQQAELIRRNNAKRKAIKELCLQLDKLTEENRILRSNFCVKCSEVCTKQNQSDRIPKLKGRLLGMFLGCPSRKE
ncbi:hypothetical protein MKW94_017033 [Papaver nudicaule]|uniref:NAB domain-containing protein n=1 Tax=Papaver nudicaule TaxID=74823 RepID=A0AA41VXM3_PAPNU|nr:hypothetical protein [Papaver nudicaule]